ncbi:hypothetical protein FQR65_LT12530 [Abscondita terminalis]|nr:hypothetical protein FQR65_LT12530 [Abscondita terminalis]
MTRKYLSQRELEEIANNIDLLNEIGDEIFSEDSDAEFEEVIVPDVNPIECSEDDDSDHNSSNHKNILCGSAGQKIVTDNPEPKYASKSFYPKLNYLIFLDHEKMVYTPVE